MARNLMQQSTAKGAPHESLCAAITENPCPQLIKDPLPNNPHQKATEDNQRDNQATTTDALTAAMGLFFHR
jgi:hypothetical protein